MAEKGEGGIRWIKGKRLNWAAYSREEPMVEVNDLSSTNLRAAKDKALKIVATKSRENMLNLTIKRLI